MSTFNLKRFAKPGILKNMRPASLAALLEPYRDYFEERKFELPQPSETRELDYQHLAEILVSPTSKTPDELANALYLINELSDAAGQEALENLGAFSSIIHDLDPQATPADVAVRCWLHDASAVEMAFAETRVTRPRSFEYSQCQTWPPAPMQWTKDTQEGLRLALEAWFVKKRRGESARVLSGASGDEVWFVVRHGDPYRREGSLEKGESKSVLYRPEKFDVLVYRPRSGELRINARSQGEKDLYLLAFGENLFGNRQYFGKCGRYTLEPLRRDGRQALFCGDIDNLEMVVLEELTLFWGGSLAEVETRRAKDLMAVYERRSRGMPKRPQLRRAKFKVKFSDGRPPRVVTVATPNRTQLTRDGDGALVEEWLVSRGFALRREHTADEAA